MKEEDGKVQDKESSKMDIKPWIVRCFLVLRIIISYKGTAAFDLILPWTAIEVENPRRQDSFRMLVVAPSFMIHPDVCWSMDGFLLADGRN